MKKVNLLNWCQIDFLSNRTRVMADLRFFTILASNLTKKYHQYRKKVNLQNWFQIDILPNRTRVMAEFCFFTIFHGNLTKKYHQYRKKWTSKTGVKSIYYQTERELWPNYVFLPYFMVIWQKNITNIEKSEPPKLVSNRLFIKQNASYGRITFFTILGCNLTKKYHQYWKKWTSKTGVKSTFYPK